MLCWLHHNFPLKHPFMFCLEEMCWPNPTASKNESYQSFVFPSKPWLFHPNTVSTSKHLYLFWDLKIKSQFSSLKSHLFHLNPDCYSFLTLKSSLFPQNHSFSLGNPLVDLKLKTFFPLRIPMFPHVLVDFLSKSRCFHPSCSAKELALHWRRYSEDWCMLSVPPSVHPKYRQSRAWWFHWWSIVINGQS